jgi:membrane fusion protein, multidrug efflux system
MNKTQALGAGQALPGPKRRSGLRRRYLLNKRRRRVWWVLLFTLPALAIYAAYRFLLISHFVITNDAYVVGNIAPLKAQTSGTVAEVAVENTQYVHQNDVLVRLDGLQAQIAFEQSRAKLAESVRQAETLFTQVERLRQVLAAHKAVQERVARDLRRYRSAAGDGAVSHQQIEDTEFQLRELEAETLQITAELHGAEALVQGTHVEDHPSVLQAASQLKQAYLDQVRQTIRAPISGYIARRTLQPGDQVHPDTPLMAIIPLDYLWIEANFLENELPQVRPGQPVDIRVDLYGNEVIYHGRVEGLSAGTGSVFGLLPPNNATGNYIHIRERVPVRIGLLPDELKAHPLRPGLSVVARIDTRRTETPVTQSTATVPTDGYATGIYQRQLDGADALIEQIIRQNRFSRF